MLLTADRLIPLRVGIISSTTIVSYSSDTTTYICGTVRSGSEEKGSDYPGRRPTGSDLHCNGLDESETEAFPWNEAPRYMIRNRDRIYSCRRY